MTIAQKLAKIAQNEPKVYAKGKADGEKIAYDAFWDAWQNYGNRTQYDAGFAGWSAGAAFLKPKYSMAPMQAHMMFYAVSGINDTNDLVTWCEECGITLDFSNCIKFGNTFQYSRITHVGIIDTTGSANTNNLFAEATYLQTVDNLILKADGSQIMSGTFYRCSALENLTITGTIGQSTNLNNCTKLTTASLISVLTALTKTASLASGKTLNLSTAVKTKIDESATATEQYNAALSAGWTIAFI